MLPRDADSGPGAPDPFLRHTLSAGDSFGGARGGCPRRPGTLSDLWLKQPRGCWEVVSRPRGVSARGRARTGRSSGWRMQGWWGSLGESRRCLNSPPTSRAPGTPPRRGSETLSFQGPVFALKIKLPAAEAGARAPAGPDLSSVSAAQHPDDGIYCALPDAWVPRATAPQTLSLAFLSLAVLPALAGEGPAGPQASGAGLGDPDRGQEVAVPSGALDKQRWFLGNFVY